MWEDLDQLNNKLVLWQHVRGHAGNIGNERCDAIARAFANGKTLLLQQGKQNQPQNDPPLTELVEEKGDNTITNLPVQPNDLLAIKVTNMDSPAPLNIHPDELPREIKVGQLRHLIDTLRIAEEIATKGYLITSSELADLMDVHASAVTSRGDEWRWRNWIVSRVRREGNQILWELERGDDVSSATGYNSDPATE